MSTMNMKRFRARIDIQHILMMMLVFMLSFSIAIPISTITVHATEANGDGQSNGSVKDAPGKGYPSYCRTGWLMYMVHKSGAVVSDVRYINVASSFSGAPASINKDYLVTKIGQRKPNLPIRFSAPWKAPFTDGNKARGKEVVNDFRKHRKWVVDCLGQSAYDNWKTKPDDYYLILEACAYHRVFTGSGTGQWILASGYGFGLADNAGFATRNGHTAWCDFEAIQNRARLEKQWPGLPAPVSGVAERSPAECVDTTKGYSLLAIRSDEKIDRAETTFVLPEAAITRGVRMGQAGNATNKNNLPYIGVRDHNQSLVNSGMWGKKQQVKLRSCKAYCIGHGHRYSCSGCVDVGHSATCPAGCQTDHGKTCPGTHWCPASCSNLDWVEKKITVGMNGKLANTGSDPVVVTNKINSKWSSPSQCPKTYTDADYNWDAHTIDPEYTHFISDMMIYRGGDKLTIAEWKNSSPDLLHNLGFACANQPQGTRYDNFGDDGDGCTQLPYTLKWNFTTTKRSTKFTTKATCACGKTSYGPCSKAAGAALGSSKVAWFDGPQTHYVTIETYSGEPQQGHQYDVESGIPDTDWNGRETTMSNHMIKVGANKYVSDSIVSYNKGSIVFYPYIRMGYHTLIGQSADAGYNDVYVMGQYQREVKANDCAEIAYDQSASANMELSSTQWSTHQAVLANSRWSSWKDVVLPGGATYNVAIDDANTKEVHLRTYQIILIGDGKTQYLKTNNLSSSQLPDIYKKSAAITNHKRFAASVIKGYERTNMTQWFSPKEVTSSGSEWESNSKKYDDTLWYNTNSSEAFEVGNESSGHDNVTIHGGDNNGKQTSSDAKYYLNSDGSGFNQSASEGDLDVGIVNSNGSVAKITSDDFTGNGDSIPIMDKIWNNTKVEYYTFYTKADAPGIFCMKVDGSGNKIADIDSSNGTYQAINDRTRLVTNMDNALEDGTGNSIAACYGAGWYNEAMDGITVMVCDTKLKVGYLSPAERSAVLDTLLTPKNEGGKKLAKLNNNGVSRDGLFGVAYYSQISTKDYSDEYGPNSHPNSANMVPYVWTPASISQESYRFSKMGEFHGQSVWVYDLMNMFYTKKFIIPNVTVQDLY